MNWPIAISIVLAAFAFSCDKNDDDNTPGSPTDIGQNLQAGDWTITKFIDSDKDETGHFSGYVFTFADGGSLTATNGTNTYTGTWTITNDDDSGPDFIIQFNLTNDFEELNEDWDFISETDRKIELIHISGGNGGTDYLTFERD